MAKMAAETYINRTKEEHRSPIRFLWAEGVPGAHIHLRMCAQYGDRVLSRRIVYEWVEMFKNGRTSVSDAERYGRPATGTAARNEDRTLELHFLALQVILICVYITDYLHFITMFLSF